MREYECALRTVVSSLFVSSPFETHTRNSPPMPYKHISLPPSTLPPSTYLFSLFLYFFFFSPFLPFFSPFPPPKTLLNIATIFENHSKLTSKIPNAPTLITQCVLGQITA